VTARTLARLLREGRLGLLWRVAGSLDGFYRIAFLGGAARAGLLRLLAEGPQPLARIREVVAPAAPADGLEAWLDFGVRLGELAKGAAGYRLRGTLARRLARPADDPVAAAVEEAAELHHRLVAGGLQLLREGRCLTLADQRGDLVARSSRVLEPFVAEAVDAVVPRRGALRLLEVGCGSGCYIRRAADRNPALTAVGLELQPDVAALARSNIDAWGLGARVVIETTDVRARVPEPAFDLVTLHNNVYYFPVGERVALFRRLRGFLRPGGRLLVTTACRGGGAAMEVLNLWASLTEGAGRLPDPAELVAQLREAGFRAARSRRLVPGESFYAFVASV
jgi:SAM-dependent methyltransferase